MSPPLTYESFPSMLNGSIINCTLDSDCPGPNGLCAHPGKIKWMATTGSQCVCPTWYGLEGPTCEGVADLGWFVFGLHCVGLLVILYDFTLVARVVRGIVVDRVPFKADASHTTFGFAAVAVSTLCVALPIFMARPFVSFSEFTDRKGHVYRETTYVHITGILTSVVYFCIIAMTLNLSLMWIQIANRVKNMTAARFASNVTSVLKYAILIYLIVFAVAIIVTSFLNVAGYTAMIALPGVLYIDSTFLVAAYKMNKLIQTLPLQPDTLESLKLIIRSAVKIFCVMMSATLTLVVMLLVGSKLNGSPPGRPIVSVLSALVYIELGVLSLCVLEYLQRAGLGMSSSKVSDTASPEANQSKLSKVTAPGVSASTASKVDLESMASPRGSSDKHAVAAYQV